MSVSPSQPGVRVVPSLLAADFGRLAEDVARVEAGGAEALHLDIMDGHFVPNISFGPGVIADLRQRSRMYFDTHLMIEEPARYAAAFAEAGSDNITFHIEVTDKPEEVIAEIRRLGKNVGVSLNPTTPAEAIAPIIKQVDLVLVMSVWPGFGGQSFMPEVLDKARRIRAMLGEHQRLEMDGGIAENTIADAASAGVEWFVAGSAVFRAPDPVVAMSRLGELARAASAGGA